jgi:hypothetical protein
VVTIQDSAETIPTSKNHTDGVASVSEGTANIPVADWAKIRNVSSQKIETNCNNNALLNHILHLVNQEQHDRCGEGTACPSGAPDFTSSPVFSDVRVVRSLVM